MDTKGQKKKKEPAESHGQAELPQRLQDQRDYVICGAESNSDVNIPASANHYMAYMVDNAWDVEAFKKNLRIDIKSIKPLRIEPKPKEADAQRPYFTVIPGRMQFELVGVDPSIANALRRILLAEVPTMAIEHVFIKNNTSIMPDEMLAHRLGMVPIRADPRLFVTKTPEETGTEKNTIVFTLNVKNRPMHAGEQEPFTLNVYSESLTWNPTGSDIPTETRTHFATDQSAILPHGAAPVHSDILLMKLRPGQCIDLEAHCTKGVGMEHAKWSPVSTAWYALKPELILLKEVRGGDAEALADALPGLVTVEVGEDGERVAVMGDVEEYPLLMEKSRMMSGEAQWKHVLQLRKRKDHFIFTIESTGVMPPEELFVEACRVLQAKCDRLLMRL